MLTSASEYSESVDLWSAGVMLYEMLSSELPFTNEYVDDLILSI